MHLETVKLSRRPASVGCGQDPASGLKAELHVPPQVVKGPVTKHLPVGAERLGFTRTAEAMAKIPGFVDELRWPAGPPVMVLGAMAHGQLDLTYVDRCAGPQRCRACAAFQGLQERDALHESNIVGTAPVLYRSRCISWIFGMVPDTAPA